MPGRDAPCATCAQTIGFAPREGYRVLVTGSRGWRWPRIVNAVLTDLHRAHPDLVIVEGRCPHGADAAARRWCARNDLTSESHAANWDGLGKRAGHVRNQHMVDLGVDLCVAFNLDDSPGTRSCARMAAKAGVEVRRFLARDTAAGTRFWWKPEHLQRDMALLTLSRPSR